MKKKIALALAAIMAFATAIVPAVSVSAANTSTVISKSAPMAYVSEDAFDAGFPVGGYKKTEITIEFKNTVASPNVVQTVFVQITGGELLGLKKPGTVVTSYTEAAAAATNGFDVDNTTATPAGATTNVTEVSATRVVGSDNTFELKYNANGVDPSNAKITFEIYYTRNSGSYNVSYTVQPISAYAIEQLTTGGANLAYVIPSVGEAGFTATTTTADGNGLIALNNITFTERRPGELNNGTITLALPFASGWTFDAAASRGAYITNRSISLSGLTLNGAVVREDLGAYYYDYNYTWGNPGAGLRSTVTLTFSGGNTNQYNLIGSFEVGGLYVRLTNPEYITHFGNVVTANAYSGIDINGTVRSTLDVARQRTYTYQPGVTSVPANIYAGFGDEPGQRSGDARTGTLTITEPDGNVGDFFKNRILNFTLTDRAGNPLTNSDVKITDITLSANFVESAATNLSNPLTWNADARTWGANFSVIEQASNVAWSSTVAGFQLRGLQEAAYPSSAEITAYNSYDPTDPDEVAARDARFPAWLSNTIPGLHFGLDGNRNNYGNKNNVPTSLTITFFVSTKANFDGEIYATVADWNYSSAYSSGAYSDVYGVNNAAGYTPINENPLLIATVFPRANDITLSSVNSSLQIGYQSGNTISVSLREPRAGLYRADSYIDIAIAEQGQNVPSPYVYFSPVNAANAEIVNAATTVALLKTPILVTQVGTYGYNSNVVRVPIQRPSSAAVVDGKREPIEILVKDLVVHSNRAAAWGNYDILVGGSAIARNFGLEVLYNDGIGVPNAVANLDRAWRFTQFGIPATTSLPAGSDESPVPVEEIVVVIYAAKDGKGTIDTNGTGERDLKIHRDTAGNTYVPLKTVSVDLGYEVAYVDPTATEKAKISVFDPVTHDGIVFTVDSAVAQVTKGGFTYSDTLLANSEVAVAVPVIQLVSEDPNFVTTFIPLRALEKIGATVNWEADGGFAVGSNLVSFVK